MSKTIRTMLSLVVSLALFSAVPMAHASGSNANKHKHKTGEHHSRFSKLAFWRHHKRSDKSVKAAQNHHARPKHALVKAAQTKTAPSTAAAGKKNQPQGQHAASKAPAEKASVASKTKQQEKVQDHTTASLKQ